MGWFWGLLLCCRMIPRWNIPPKSNKKYSNTEWCPQEFPSKYSLPTIQVAIEPRKHIAPPGCRLFLLFHLWKTGVTPPQREGGERSWTFTTWWCWEDWRVKVKQPGWWRKGTETDPAVERVPDDRQGDLRQHLSKDHRWRVPGQQLQVLKYELASPLVILQTDHQVHNRPFTSKLQRSHHLPHAKPALGELHVSHLQVGVGKCFFFDFPQDCLP